MSTEADARLRGEWPSALGAMVLLSRLKPGRFLEARGQPARLLRGSRSKPVFSRILARDWSVLHAFHDPGSAEAVVAFVSSVGGFRDRFHGDSDNDSDYLYARAVYGLVYLAKSAPIAELLLSAYVPLLRPGLWDRPFRFRVAHTFWGDVGHLLYEVEGLDEAGDHEPFDWLGNLNDRDESDRARLLADTGLRPFDHPGFPPQDVWITHTNVMPIPDEDYHEVLRDLYRERGYVC